MKIKNITLLLAVISILAVTGCRGTATHGAVTAAPNPSAWETGPQVGLRAPDVKFTTLEQKAKTLHPSDGWVTVIGFIGNRKTCCSVDESLKHAAGQFWTKPVRVIQVSLPTTKCAHGPGCVACRHVKTQHLMALCDSSKIAHKAYGSPTEGTVLLIDGEGKVSEITSASKLKSSYEHIDKLAARALEESIPGYADVYDLDD